MIIYLHYTAQLAMEAGCSAEKLELCDDATVEQVVKDRANKHGGKFAEIVLSPDGDPVPTIMYVVNGEQVDRGTPHILKDGDELMLMSPIAGG